MRCRTIAAVLATGLLASACVVVPVTMEGYDSHCQIATHHMALQTVQLRAMVNCEHAGEVHVCEAMVIASAGVVAASAIVSSSIVVVGNVVYWAQERVGCAAPPGPAES
jgi:hypothetical protein